jgi:hypothetical protein
MMIAFFMRRIFPVVVFDAKSEMIEISGVNVLVMSSSTNPASKIVFWPRLLLVAIASAFSESPYPLLRAHWGES